MRKDALLSGEVEFAIPREMNRQQGVALAQDFVRAEFVGRGMVCAETRQPGGRIGDGRVVFAALPARLDYR